MEPLEAVVTAQGSSQAFAEARTFEFCRLPTFEVRPRAPGVRVRSGRGVNLLGSASHGAGAIELAKKNVARDTHTLTPCGRLHALARVRLAQGGPTGPAALSSRPAARR